MGTSLGYLTDEELKKQQEQLAQQDQANQADQAAPADQPAPQDTGTPSPQEPPPAPEPPPQQVPFGSGTMPPPPPPPPPAPEFTDLSGKTAQFASEWLDQPNRYLSDLSQATRAANEANLTQQETLGKRDIEEWAQGRGLVGSSYEGEQQVALKEAQQRARGDYQQKLLEMLANAESMDKAAAAQNALQASQFGETQGLQRYLAGLEGYKAVTGAQFTQQDLDQRAEQIKNQAAQFGQTLTNEQAQAEANRQLTREQMAQQAQQFTQTLNISQQQVDQRAKELMQGDRTLDLQAARDQATVEIARAQIAQQSEQFYAGLGQRQTEFTQTLAEQQATRLQQYGISQQQLDLETQRVQQADRSLSIQEAQGQAEINLRAQQLAQEAATSGRTLDLTEARLAAEREISLQQLGISRDQLNVEAQRYQAEAAAQNRIIDLTQARDLAAIDLQNKQLGISQQDIDLRAKQLVQEATAQNRQLDQVDAAREAQVQLAREQMQFQATLQGNELAQREAEFARSFGLNQQQFVAQQEQFAKQYSEQVASRLQQDTQFQATLQNAQVQQALDAGLRQRALDLQQQGMSIDAAFKQAALVQENNLTMRAQDIQMAGIAKEDAYRYASLEQDSRFRQAALDLQDKGLTLEDAYRYAELTYRQDTLAEQKSEFNQEMQFKLAQATTDQERFDAMLALWDKYFGGGGTSLTGQPVGEPIPNLPPDINVPPPQPQ